MSELKAVTELQCPSCKSKVLWNNDYPFRPFCSKRCQQIDFGGWANEDNKIAGSSVYDDMNSDDMT
jgi:hypothetical protein